jgi:hypothetical protein
MHQMGIYAGVIIGGFSGYAADDPALGWRWMFETCGLIGVLYALPLFLLLGNAPAADQADTGIPTRGGAFRELLGNRSFILLVLYFTLPAMAGWIVRDWMPCLASTTFTGQRQLFFPIGDNYTLCKATLEPYTGADRSRG